MQSRGAVLIGRRKEENVTRQGTSRVVGCDPQTKARVLSTVEHLRNIVICPKKMNGNVLEFSVDQGNFPLGTRCLSTPPDVSVSFDFHSPQIFDAGRKGRCFMMRYKADLVVTTCYGCCGFHRRRTAGGIQSAVASFEPLRRLQQSGSSCFSSLNALIR
jgi:hypothetical protein